jgi:hypothetical protein
MLNPKSGVGRESPVIDLHSGHARINTAAELTAFVELTSDIWSSVASEATAAFIKPVIDALAERIVCMDRRVVVEFARNRTSLMLALKILAAAKEHDALLCLAISIDFPEGDDDFKAKVFQLAFDVDVRESHSWVLTIDTFLERVLMNTLVLPSFKEFRADNVNVLALKRVELEYLRRHGHSIHPTEALAALSFGLAEAKVSSDISKAKSPRCLAIAHPLQSVLQSLAFHSPELFSDLAQRSDSLSIVRDLYTLRRFRPVYLVISNLSYPMGGGESFMHQTCRILIELGYRCVWVSFSVKGDVYSTPSEARTPYFEEIKIEGGASAAKIDGVIERFRPDVIHSHGATNFAVAEAAVRYRIPTLIGFHFWNGLVRLNANTNNRDILKFAELHKAQPDIFRRQRPFVSTYVASEFMLDVYQKAGGRTKHQVFHPIPDPSHYQSNPSRSGTWWFRSISLRGKAAALCSHVLKRSARIFHSTWCRPNPDPKRLTGRSKPRLGNRPDPCLPDMVRSRHTSAGREWSSSRLSLTRHSVGSRSRRPRTESLCYPPPRVSCRPYWVRAAFFYRKILASGSPRLPNCTMTVRAWRESDNSKRSMCWTVSAMCQ